MDHEGRYSNPPRTTTDQGLSLVRAISHGNTRHVIDQLYEAFTEPAPGVQDRAERARPERQRQHRLETDEIKLLTAAYEAGSTIADLADRFRLNKTTVRAHLRRAGVPTRLNPIKLTADDVGTVANLYARGQSLAVIGKQFGVNAETVRKALVRSGVSPRARKGWPAAGSEAVSPCV